MIKALSVVENHPDAATKRIFANASNLTLFFYYKFKSPLLSHWAIILTQIMFSTALLSIYFHLIVLFLLK